MTIVSPPGHTDSLFQNKSNGSKFDGLELVNLAVLVAQIPESVQMLFSSMYNKNKNITLPTMITLLDIHQRTHNSIPVVGKFPKQMHANMYAWNTAIVEHVKRSGALKRQH